MTKFPDIFEALARPLPEQFIRVRKHDGAHYITARCVMNVFDTVLGPENWVAEYERWSEHAVFCRITITLPDGTRLTKGDVGSDTSMGEKSKGTDPGEDEKGGVSDALKRAAVLFGVGRFLYNDGIPDFRDPSEVRDDPPPPPRQEPRQGGNGNGNGNGEKRTGKAMFAWVAEQDKKDENLRLLKHMNDWAKREGYPSRMVDWSPDDIPAAYAEAQKHIRSVYGPGSGE